MPAAGLSKDAWAVLGVFFGSLIMWIGISIDWPSMITLMALGLIPVFGFSGTFAGAFGNTTVAFLLFTFMLVYPLSKTHFVRRCAIAFITNKIARKGPWHFICFFLNFGYIKKKAGMKNICFFYKYLFLIFGYL